MYKHRESLQTEKLGQDNHNKHSYFWRTGDSQQSLTHSNSEIQVGRRFSMDGECFLIRPVFCPLGMSPKSTVPHVSDCFSRCSLFFFTSIISEKGFGRQVILATWVTFSACLLHCKVEGLDNFLYFWKASLHSFSPRWQQCFCWIYHLKHFVNVYAFDTSLLSELQVIPTITFHP